MNNELFVVNEKHFPDGFITTICVTNSEDKAKLICHETNQYSTENRYRFIKKIPFFNE